MDAQLGLASLMISHNSVLKPKGYNTGSYPLSMERVTSEDYHTLTRLLEPRVSPDGKTVAIVERSPANNSEYRQRISLVDVATGEQRRLTGGIGKNSSIRWSPDGESIAFVTDRDSDDPQLALCDVRDGQVRQLTDTSGSVSDPAWSSSGDKIAFVQNVTAEVRDAGQDLQRDAAFEPSAPDPRVIDRLVYRSGAEYFDGRYSQLYVVDVEAAEITRLTAGEFDVLSPVWLDDSTICYIRKDGPDTQDSIEFSVYRTTVTDGTSTELATDTDWVPRLAADTNRRLAWPRTHAERATLQRTELAVFDLRSRETSTPLADFDHNIERHRQFCWDDGSLLVSVPDEGDVVVYRLQEGKSPEALFSDGHVLSFHAANGTVAAVQSQATHPGELVTITDSERRQLTRANEEYLSRTTLSSPEEVWFESDGEQIQGWILYPPDTNPEADHPLIVNIHGGPHLMWSTSGLMWHEFQTLAAAGYAVFWCNPRGSTGYGSEFAGATDDGWGSITMRDILAGVETVVANQRVRSDDLFLTGGSFGGYMTAWMVAHTDRFRAAVAQRGLYDLSSYYGSTDTVHKIIEWEFGTVPWQDHARLWAHSPIAHVEKVSTPTRILHAENDYRTPLCTAEFFYRALKQNDVTTQLVQYPREGHDLARNGEPGHVVDRLDRIVDWFDAYRTDDDTDIPESDRGS